MKKITLILSILLIGATAVSAQDERRSHRDRKHTPRKEQTGRARWGQHLKLTDEQNEKVKKMDADYQQERNAIERSRVSPDMQQTKLKELREKRQNDFKNLLTDEQKAIWNERKTGDRNKRFDGRRPSSRRPTAGAHLGSGKRMFDGIELSDKQKDEFEKITEGGRAQMQEINKDYRLKREQLTKKQKDAIGKILTEEQKQKFAENQKKIAGRRSESKIKKELPKS